MRDRRFALLVALIAVAAFAPALAGGFVYDDHRFHESNPHLSHASILWRAFADPVCQTADGTEAGLWRPLRTLSFALDKSIFGDSPLGPHAVNVLLHGAGAACLFALLRRLGAREWAALAGALVYALHPAQVETVAWISSRGDLLAIACVLGALVASLDERPKTALALGAAALLAKEQAVVWPLFVPIAMRLAGRDLGESFRKALAPAAVVAAFVVVRHFVLAEPTQQGGLGEGPAGLRQIAAMSGHQAWYAALPVGTLFDWQMPPDELPRRAAIVFVAACAAALWRPTRLPVLWFCAALIPTLFIQAFMPLNILVADRFLLFALPALAIGVARAWDAGAAAPALAGVVCFGALTETQIPVWRDDVSLWSSTAAREPTHWRANYWLGRQAWVAGNVDEAADRFRTAAMTPAADGATWCMYALALERQGFRDADPQRTSDARVAYARAVELFQRPRAEGRSWLLPTARVGIVELSLVLDERETAEGALRALVASTPPSMPAQFVPAFRDRVERLARGVEEQLRDVELAKSLRSWGAAQ